MNGISTKQQTQTIKTQIVMKKVFLFLLMAVAGLAATQAQQEYHSVPFDLDNGFEVEQNGKLEIIK